MKVTRSEIHALVWHQPAAKVAALLAVSGNTLKKSCELRGIPTPPRGYWQQLAAGKETSVEPLRPVHFELTLPWEKTKAFDKALREMNREITQQDVDSDESIGTSILKVPQEALGPPDAGLGSWQAQKPDDRRRPPYPEITEARKKPDGVEEPFELARDAELKAARELARDRIVLREVAEICLEILHAANYQAPTVKKAMQDFVSRVRDQASLAEPVMKAIRLCSDAEQAAPVSPISHQRGERLTDSSVE